MLFRGASDHAWLTLALLSQHAAQGRISGRLGTAPANICLQEDDWLPRWPPVSALQPQMLPKGNFLMKQFLDRPKMPVCNISEISVVKAWCTGCKVWMPCETSGDENSTGFRCWEFWRLSSSVQGYDGGWANISYDEENTIHLGDNKWSKSSTWFAQVGQLQEKETIPWQIMSPCTAWTLASSWRC